MTTKKIVLIVAGVVVVLGFLVLLFVGAIVGFALYQLGNSEAAARAEDFLRNSPKLKEDIGEVKDFGSIVTGGINLSGGSGRAPSSDGRRARRSAASMPSFRWRAAACRRTSPTRRCP